MSVVLPPDAYATRLAGLRVLGRLTGHTFRQSLISGASCAMLTVSAVCVAGCLLAPLGSPAAVYAVEQTLAEWVIHIGALLLALILTAGILPAFLAARTASVLLTKPVPRWLLLAGVFFGVLAFVAVHAVGLVGGVWLALAARSGVWDAGFLLSAPLLVLHFAVFFSFSAMLASATRNTAACAFGTVLFWVLCWAMNFGHNTAMELLDAHHLSPAYGWIIDGCYWLLPKPLDFQLANRGGLPMVGWSLLASALCGAALLAAAAYDFGTAEY